MGGVFLANPVVLRDYQLQLLADLRAALKRHRRVCAVMPTGAGKGQTIGAIVQGAAGKGRRVLVLLTEKARWLFSQYQALLDESL